MAEQTGQERTEEATEKRKSDSRKKGEVLRSKELTTFLSLMAAGAGLLIFGAQIINDLQLFFFQHLNLDITVLTTQDGITSSMSASIRQASLLLLPFLGTMFIAMTAGPLAMGGWSMSLDQLKPKFERIDPIKGLGRIFSWRSLLELVKALAKFILVASVVILVFSIILDDLLSLTSQPLMSALVSVAGLFTWCFLGFSAVLIVVVGLDVPFQVWSFNKKLRMTKQEIKDEMKETDGRPEIKRAIREKQQELSRQRMMAAVPTADVIITNPTHYAVALKYNQQGSQAPIVVAKGRDLVAAAIREVASTNKVTIFEAPPLARALYSSTDINQQIPENLFLAVAQVLAYIFQLRQSGTSKKKPIAPKHLPVPREYDSPKNSAGDS